MGERPQPRHAPLELRLAEAERHLVGNLGWDPAVLRLADARSALEHHQAAKVRLICRCGQRLETLGLEAVHDRDLRAISWIVAQPRRADPVGAGVFANRSTWEWTCPKCRARWSRRRDRLTVAFIGALANSTNRIDLTQPVKAPPSTRLPPGSPWRRVS